VTETASAGSTGAGESVLGRAIARGITMLGDLAPPDEAIGSGRLERDLRSAIGDTTGRQDAAAAPVVRAACAHLAVGELADAYLALLTARDLLST